MTVEEKRRRDERFIEAIRQNRAGMFRVARMMLRSDSDAEEAVADADGLHWAKPQTGMLEFDVPRVQSQSFAMQTSVGWAEWLTVTGVRVSTTPLGMALEIDYRPSARLGEALPEFVVEDDERVINRHGELSRTGDEQTGYTVCMQTDLPSSLPHALTLGVRGLDESIRFDFDTQTAAMTKGAER